MSVACNSLKNYFINLSINHSETANYLKLDVLEPAKKFLDDQITLGKKLYNDIKKWEKDLKDMFDKLEKVF